MRVNDFLNYILNAASKLIESCLSSVSYFEIISFVGVIFITVGIPTVNWKADKDDNYKNRTKYFVVQEFKYWLRSNSNIWSQE